MTERRRGKKLSIITGINDTLSSVSHLLIKGKEKNPPAQNLIFSQAGTGRERGVSHDAHRISKITFNNGQVKEMKFLFVGDGVSKVLDDDGNLVDGNGITSSAVGTGLEEYFRGLTAFFDEQSSDHTLAGDELYTAARAQAVERLQGAWEAALEKAKAQVEQMVAPSATTAEAMISFCVGDRLFLAGATLGDSEAHTVWRKPNGTVELRSVREHLYHSELDDEGNPVPHKHERGLQRMVLFTPGGKRSRYDKPDIWFYEVPAGGKDSDGSRFLGMAAWSDGGLQAVRIKETTDRKTLPEKLGNAIIVRDPTEIQSIFSNGIISNRESQIKQAEAVGLTKAQAQAEVYVDDATFAFTGYEDPSSTSTDVPQADATPKPNETDQRVDQEKRKEFDIATTTLDLPLLGSTLEIGSGAFDSENRLLFAARGISDEQLAITHNPDGSVTISNIGENPLRSASPEATATSQPVSVKLLTGYSFIPNAPDLASAKIMGFEPESIHLSRGEMHIFRVIKYDTAQEMEVEVAKIKVELTTDQKVIFSAAAPKSASESVPEPTPEPTPESTPESKQYHTTVELPQDGEEITVGANTFSATVQDELRISGISRTQFTIKNWGNGKLFIKNIGSNPWRLNGETIDLPSGEGQQLYLNGDAGTLSYSLIKNGSPDPTTRFTIAVKGGKIDITATIPVSET